MQEQVANVILGIAGPSDCFTIRYGWFRFKLKIKPLTARQIIEISGQLSKIKDINTETDMFPGVIEGSPDLLHICKAITIATGTKFRRLVTRAVLDLPLKDIETLLKIVKKQTDCELFFYTIILAKGLNKLKLKEEQ
jgi:hypothetical protein